MRNISFSSVLRRSGTLASVGVICCAAAFAQTKVTGQTSTPAETTSPNATVQQNGSQTTVNAPMDQSGDPSASMQDKAFLKKALEGSMAEVQVAQLALTKTSNDQIKQFAQRMITDHTKMLDVTKAVAQQNGVAIPSGPSKKEVAAMAKLQSLSGADFDKAYVKAMLKDHKDDDNDFKVEAENAQIPSVKMLASRGEPVIASHLLMIEQISKSMNGGSGM